MLKALLVKISPVKQSTTNIPVSDMAWPAEFIRLTHNARPGDGGQWGML